MKEPYFLKHFLWLFVISYALKEVAIINDSAKKQQDICDVLQLETKQIFKCIFFIHNAFKLTHFHFYKSSQIKGNFSNQNQANFVYFSSYLK